MFCMLGYSCFNLPLVPKPFFLRSRLEFTIVVRKQLCMCSASTSRFILSPQLPGRSMAVIDFPGYHVPKQQERALLDVDCCSSSVMFLGKLGLPGLEPNSPERTPKYWNIYFDCISRACLPSIIYVFVENVIQWNITNIPWCPLIRYLDPWFVHRHMSL